MAPLMDELLDIRMVRADGAPEGANCDDIDDSDIVWTEAIDLIWLADIVTLVGAEAAIVTNRV